MKTMLLNALTVLLICLYVGWFGLLVLVASPVILSAYVYRLLHLASR